MRNQFDNYEKRIMEKLDREAEDIERRIGEDPQVAEAEADEELDRKVYAGVDAYEDAIAERNHAGADGVVRVDIDMKETVETIGASDAAEFVGLSEEDREALRLGRELQKRRREEESRKEAEGKTRKYAGRWKHIVAAAAVLVLVAGVGVNGIGGPNRVVEIMTQAVSGRKMSQGNSSAEETKLSGDNAEKMAYQQIKDELGIDPVRPLELPGGTKFKMCEVDTEIRLAQLIYLFGDRNFTYLISDSYVEELWSVDIEDEILDEYPYTEGRLNAEIVEYELSGSKEKKYTAEFEYNGVYYQLIGTMEWGNFEKILKNLYFPA